MTAKSLGLAIYYITLESSGVQINIYSFQVNHKPVTLPMNSDIGTTLIKAPFEVCAFFQFYFKAPFKEANYFRWRLI